MNDLILALILSDLCNIVFIGALDLLFWSAYQQDKRFYREILKDANIGKSKDSI